MKLYLLTESIDIYIGFRLAGIEGEILEKYDSFLESTNRVCADKEIGIVLVTEKLVAANKEQFFEIKTRSSSPIFLEIPSICGSYNLKETIKNYISTLIKV